MNNNHDSEAAFDALQCLAHCAADPTWIGDADNQLGITLDVDHAFEVAPAFKSYRVERNPTGCAAEAEWNGAGDNLASVERGIFAVLGELNEQACFVARELGRDEVVYRIVTGCTSGEMRHGHFVVIRVRGERIRAILERMRRLTEEWSALPRDSDGRPILRP